MVKEAEKVEKILKGEITPTFSLISYKSALKRSELKNIKKIKQEILKRKEINWQSLNTFVIKL